VTQKVDATVNQYRYDLTDQLTNGPAYSASYDAVGNRLTADGIDQAVLMRAGDEHADAMYAIITDHLGSVVAILDSNGDLVETYEYTPFGKTTIKNSSGTVISESVLNNVLGFTGREFDTNTGLYYYRNRWYSPDLGRFLEPDPIGLRAGDVNLYRYVWNDPLRWVDPFGLELEAPPLWPPSSPSPGPCFTLSGDCPPDPCTGLPKLGGPGDDDKYADKLIPPPKGDDKWYFPPGLPIVGGKPIPPIFGGPTPPKVEPGDIPISKPPKFPGFPFKMIKIPGTPISVGIPEKGIGGAIKVGPIPF
jgi:RHS repeat-associated protein